MNRLLVVVRLVRKLDGVSLVQKFDPTRRAETNHVLNLRVQPSCALGNQLHLALRES